MSLIKKVFSFSYLIVLISICVAIIVFRTIDAWSGFSISKKYLDPIIGPLFEKFPTVTAIIAALLVALFIIFYLAKLDVKKDELEKDATLEDDNDK